MNKLKIGSVLVLAAVLLAACSVGTIGGTSTAKKKGKPMELKTDLDSASYGLGVSLANNFKAQGIDELNGDAFLRGLKDVFDGNDLAYTEEECMSFVQEYMSKVQMKKAEANKTAGEEFLAENGKRGNVTVLPSGLQYEIMTEGNGPKPLATQTVKTHYHGTLIDGTVFDSSVQRGEPISFPVNGVIRGWQEALQLMPVGSKWKLYIPYDLAYGERGAGADIGPFSALIFEVELISIEN